MAVFQSKTMLGRPGFDQSPNVIVKSPDPTPFYANSSTKVETFYES